MSDSEHWHEWGLVLFYGMTILSIVYLFPIEYRLSVWIVLSIIKLGMSTYQELYAERGGIIISLLYSHDGIYDWVFRTFGSILLGGFWILPNYAWFPMYIMVLLITYKWEWFNK